MCAPPIYIEHTEYSQPYSSFPELFTPHESSFLPRTDRGLRCPGTVRAGYKCLHGDYSGGAYAWRAWLGVVRRWSTPGASVVFPTAVRGDRGWSGIFIVTKPKRHGGWRITTTPNHARPEILIFILTSARPPPALPPRAPQVKSVAHSSPSGG